ncbi:MAG: divergent polysaccharide deacetylase family protein [Candidatus Omnitrophica bacterium]|nr:divergent polysaccharide deacetylase family protein [Candidatus Omnitrophota bacterium]
MRNERIIYLVIIVILLGVVAFKFFGEKKGEVNRLTSPNVVYTDFPEEPAIIKKSTAPAKKIPDVIENEYLLAVVIDDFGYANSTFSLLETLDGPITMAVLPNLTYSKAAALLAEKKDFEVILHLPMQPTSDKAPLEKNTIMIGMLPVEIKDIIKNDLTSLSNVKGISNHMGSKATADMKIMNEIMAFAKKNNMFFLDSYTNKDTVCCSVAGPKGVSCYKRDIFIDNIADKDLIKEQFEKAVDLAKKKGSAIAIGHDKLLTIQVLAEEFPKLHKDNVRLVKVSELIDDNNMSKVNGA